MLLATVPYQPLECFENRLDLVITFLQVPDLGLEVVALFALGRQYLFEHILFPIFAILLVLSVGVPNTKQFSHENWCFLNVFEEVVHKDSVFIVRAWPIFVRCFKLLNSFMDNTRHFSGISFERIINLFDPIYLTGNFLELLLARWLNVDI